MVSYTTRNKPVNNSDFYFAGCAKFCTPADDFKLKINK